MLSRVPMPAMFRECRRRAEREQDEAAGQGEQSRGRGMHAAEEIIAGA